MYAQKIELYEQFLKYFKLSFKTLINNINDVSIYDFLLTFSFFCFIKPLLIKLFPLKIHNVISRLVEPFFSKCLKFSFLKLLKFF